MGNCHTKDKSSSKCNSSSTPTETMVEGLKNKVRLLQGEIHEIMCIRETESQAYERELIAFAFKQAEWKRERKRLKEEAKKIMEERQDHKLMMQRCCMTRENKSCCILDHSKDEQSRRDETIKKWKQLYFTIKDELDHLIQRTHEEERLVCWKTEEEEVILELKNELRSKEERIELLQAKLASMEHQESKREREMDILRQSLRIMSHKRRATKWLARGAFQEF